ncbi:hypothetical protein NGA_0190700 [Nannochloropsis gaditana CCMP526]|nr:hypothetical protein NGA_0190700 [Nannochloropsis gaditana CCMP526]EKU22052.1 hypothetical protein NGA_0190700 [Nannochloropsis gaditana CCMP526]|eukprot:XP_005854313.1 hypothetical protein NGA_0190700 [Nannochloropsis gaditana CCMP526]
MRVHMIALVRFALSPRWRITDRIERHCLAI